MATEKKERHMSPKGFLFKMTTKAAASATGFLAAYREYLVNGEVGYVTAPIVEKVEAGELMATPAMDMIKHAVFAHMIECDRIHAQESLEKSSQRESATKKHFSANIIDTATGQVAMREKEDGSTELLSKAFDKPQDAERWIDRRLFDGCPSWYGEVKHHGVAWSMIERIDSIARILKRPRGSVCKTVTYGGSTLGFVGKAHEKPVKFSRG